MKTTLSRNFETALGEFKDILESFSENLLNCSIEGEGWTAAQVGDHICHSMRIKSILNGQIEASDRPADHKVEKIREVFEDMEKRYEAPGDVLPSGGFIHKKVLLSRLTMRINELEESIEVLDLNQMCISAKHPGFGYLTRLEWLWFSVFHTRRHTRQLKRLAEKLNTF